jgi:hypothetical protein
MISKPDVEDLNYSVDTLMFGGVLLVASRAFNAPFGGVKASTALAVG